MAELSIISLGWGVQSWGLAAMAALGELPPIDAAVHADTGWERSETIAFAQYWTPWLEEHGVHVMTVQAPERKRILNDSGGIFIPAHTAREDNSHSGQLRRQCTHDWKIMPIRRYISNLLGAKTPGAAEVWLGISSDEAHRAKPSGVKYAVNRWPYLEMLDMPWSRSKIARWLRSHKLEIPLPSSCIICPYHDNATWRRIKLADNGDWQRAVDVDRAIRHERPGFICYLHSSRQPLEDVRLGIEQLEWRLEGHGE